MTILAEHDGLGAYLSVSLLSLWSSDLERKNKDEELPFWLHRVLGTLLACQDATVRIGDLGNLQATRYV